MDIENQEGDENSDKTFIDVLLGEMKNQFNKTDKRISPELLNFTSEEEVYNNGNDSNLNLEIKTEDACIETDHVISMETNVKEEIKEELDVEINYKTEELPTEEVPELNKEDVDASEEQEEKPRIVITFRKPNTDDNNKIKNNSEGGTGSGRRTLRAKLHIVDDKMILKRSARRRSRDCNESVLQSAIARKEKSYNEASKPQRLTRQLKATPKILENLANAALKLEKTKPKAVKGPEKQKLNENGSDNDSEDNIQNESDLENDKTCKKTKSKTNKSKQSVKRLKTVHNDVTKGSDSDHSIPEGEGSLKINCNTCDVKNKIYKTRVSTEDKSCRRSHRLSSRNREDSVTNDELKSDFNVEDQEITAVVETSHQSILQPCLCTQLTQFYLSNIDEDVIYCTAIDNIGDKLIGCSRVVIGNEVSLMRPSTRVPYIVLCEIHFNRMLRHNCCPKCGLFCTQGQFVECERKHQYHRECQVSQGDSDYCPHCGSVSPEFDISIKMHSLRKPVFLPQQKCYHPAAKMTFHYEEPDDADAENLQIMPSTLAECLNSDGTEIYDLNNLVECVKEGDHEKLARVLAQKSLHLNSKFDEFEGGSVLHYAAENDMLTVVHLLVMAGAELNVLNTEQNTPMVSAILAHKNKIVKYLIKAGASIDLKGTDGMTALHLASKSGNSTACKLLLDASPRTSNYVNTADDGGWTPLVWACEHGHFEVAKYLLQKSADPVIRDVEQNIALHWAAFSGSSNIAEVLLNCKNEINAVNAYGDTPLHIGARQNSYDCVLILLLRGANVHVRNKTDELPLDCALPSSGCYNIIALNAYLHSLTTSDDLPSQLILCNDISRGQEKHPIQCINLVDTEEQPSDYIYVSTNCITSDEVNIDYKATSLHSCDCEEKCGSFECVCCNSSLQCWYNEDRKLIMNFNYFDPPMIFECNQYCNCNAITCNNRVVQHGLTTRLQLFKTDTKGWAIRTLCNISKGSFVCEYIGEIIPDAEADKREDDSYVFDLDSNRGNEAYCIDAKRYGNFARFINHSCDANLVPLRVFIDHHDMRFPRIAFFANRDIVAEEELSFDYGERFWIIKYKSFTCCCGSENCKYSEDAIVETIETYNRGVQETM